MARRQNRTPARTEGVIAYLRVSTDEQATSGLGLDAQRAQLVSECERRGLLLLAVYEDAGLSGSTLDRPALREALAALDAGQGSALMVAKLDRLTRSVHNASGLMKRAETAGWGLVALDVAVDTTTPQGTAMAQVLVVFAELERRLIGQRTRDALAVRKAQGFKLGRPRTLDPAVRQRILDEAATGAGWSAIARSLNDGQVPTAQGGARWYPATVRAVVMADRSDQEAAA
jgi:DNA invertase Pin-like site-specific DNA recombinase